MSTSTLTPTLERPRFLRAEPFAALATAAGVGLIWWMGGVQARSEAQGPICPQGDRVTSAQVEQAAGRVRAANDRARSTAMGGSPYAAAKIGLPRSSPEYRLAQAAAGELTLARQDLARVCAEAAR